MNDLLFVLLDGGNANGGGEGSPMGNYTIWIMLGLMIVVFYFFMIRPQNKRQKELRKFRENLKVGDKVVTTGGIHGKVSQIKDDNTFLVEVDNDVRIKIDKGSILNEQMANQQASQGR